MSTYNEMNLKELIIHTSVALRNNIIKQKTITSSIRQPEIPIRKEDHDCVNCNIF